MGGQRAVAGLAGYSGMLALALSRSFVGVAGFANGVPGELHGVRSNVDQGRGAEVSVLSEIRRDNYLSKHQKGTHPDSQEHHDTDEVFRVPKEFLHACCNMQLASPIAKRTQKCFRISEANQSCELRTL